MNIYKKFTSASVLILVSFFAFAASVHAATISISTATDVVHIGDTIEVLLKIDSQGVGVNAVQGTLQYPNDILQATKIDRTDSVFDFWLQDPTFSNDTGKVIFIGGSTVGSVGKSLQALRVTFIVKGAGKANLTLTDAAITASDGSGSNVLSTINQLAINSVPATGTTTTTPAVVVPKLIPPPTQITRPAAKASGLPVKPEVTIPLYPDSATWSNATDVFIAQWKLPADVSAVSTAIDQNVNYSGVVSEGLFESKVFAAIPRDGVWYLHARFKNNIGWGPSNNYRIAVDTHPPLAFAVTVAEGNTTDTPTPTLQFNAKDSLSGLKEYQVAVDNGEPQHIDVVGYTGTYKMLAQAPGKHRITVRAVDNADNSAEGVVTVEIFPIASPSIGFVTQDLFSNKQTGVSIRGSSLPNINVVLSLHSGSSVISTATTHTDDKGNWQYLFNSQLINGNYAVRAQNQDARGALSLVVESSKITVESEPIFQLGIIRLGAGGAALLLLLLLIGSFGGGVWYWKKKNEKLSLRVGFAGVEITKIFKIIAEDIKKMSEALKTTTAIDDEYAMKKLEENLAKMESYIKKGVEKINK